MHDHHVRLALRRRLPGREDRHLRAWADPRPRVGLGEDRLKAVDAWEVGAALGARCVDEDGERLSGFVDERRDEAPVLDCRGCQERQESKSAQEVQVTNAGKVTVKNERVTSIGEDLGAATIAIGGRLRRTSAPTSDSVETRSLSSFGTLISVQSGDERGNKMKASEGSVR